MPGQTKRLCFFVLFFCVAQTTNASNNLELKLFASTSTVVTGTPFYIQMRLVNNSDTAVKAPQHLSPDYQLVRFEIEGPSGKSWFSPAIKKRPVTPYAPLEAGKTRFGTAEVYYGSQGWTFKEPGSYRIRALFQGGLYSNTIDIQLVTPDKVPEDLRSVWMGESDVGWFFKLGGGDHLEEARAILRRAIKEAPESVYANIASYALGKNFLQKQTNFETGVVREADLPQAIDSLEPVAEKIDQTDLALEALSLLEQVYLGAGDEENAQRSTALKSSLLNINFHGYEREAWQAWLTETSSNFRIAEPGTDARE